MAFAAEEAPRPGSSWGLGERQETQWGSRRLCSVSDSRSLGLHILMDTPPSLQSCSITVAEDQYHLPTSHGEQRLQQGEGAEPGPRSRRHPLQACLARGGLG